MRIIIGALLAAALCYTLGLHWEALILMALGILFEGVFWFNVLKGSNHEKSRPAGRL